MGTTRLGNPVPDDGTRVELEFTGSRMGPVPYTTPSGVTFRVSASPSRKRILAKPTDVSYLLSTGVFSLVNPPEQPAYLLEDDQVDVIPSMVARETSSTKVVTAKKPAPKKPAAKKSGL